MFQLQPRFPSPFRSVISPVNTPKRGPSRSNLNSRSLHAISICFKQGTNRYIRINITQIWRRERITVCYYCLQMNNTTKYTRVPKGGCPPIQWSRGPSNMTQGSTLAAVTCPFSATVSSVLSPLWSQVQIGSTSLHHNQPPFNDEPPHIYKALCPRKLGFPCTRVSKTSLTAKENPKVI